MRFTFPMAFLLFGCNPQDDTPVDRVRSTPAEATTIASTEARVSDTLEGREESLILETLRSRIRGIRDNNLSFSELILADRNRFFEWIKEPQARIRDGQMPRESDLTRMIDTYRGWAMHASANRKWLTEQLGHLQQQLMSARDRAWRSEEKATDALDCVDQGDRLVVEVLELIKLRGELEQESEARRRQIEDHRRILFGR